MTKTTLTDAYLRKLKPTGKRVEISDAATTGLRVRVSPTGEISFVLKARGGPAAAPITVTLGRYPDLSLKEARAEATQKRLDLKADRAARVLAVRAAHVEAGCAAPDMLDPLAAELRLLARWLGLPAIAVEHRGDLARPLAAHLAPRRR